MSADVFLARLDGVRCTGPDRWIAKCPSHADRRPSLAIRELSDGRILIHDFAGCAVQDVLAAVGLTFDALFPERLGEFKSERRPFPAADVLGAIGFETLFCRHGRGQYRKRNQSFEDRSTAAIAGCKPHCCRRRGVGPCVTCPLVSSVARRSSMPA